MLEAALLSDDTDEQRSTVSMLNDSRPSIPRDDRIGIQNLRTNQFSVADDPNDGVASVERSSFQSIARWSYWSSILERALFWMFIRPVDLAQRVRHLNKLSGADLEFQSPRPSSASSTADYRPDSENNTCNLKRTWVSGNSIMVQRKRTVKRVRLAQSFLSGITLTTTTAIHYFFYVVLVYRLYQLVSTGHSEIGEVWDVLTNINGNGLVNLVQPLARLPPSYLKLILGLIPVPTLILLLYSACSQQVLTTESAAQAIPQADPFRASNRSHLSLDSWLFAELLQWIPLFSISNRISSLGWRATWQGSLSSDARIAIFDHIRQCATHSHKHIQRASMRALAYFIVGNHTRDLQTLSDSGVDKEDISTMQYIKQQSLETLQQLTLLRPVESTDTVSRIYGSLKQWTRVGYAHYLLWWSGYSRFRLISVLFWAFNLLKLAAEIILLINLVATIKNALDCPKQPGFVFGQGFKQDWSGDFTAQCFSERLRLFRTLDPSESVSDLVSELTNYHLDGLTSLSLSDKSLDSHEVSSLLSAIVRQGAASTLESINLQSNHLGTVDASWFVPFTALQILKLDYNSISSLHIPSLPRLGALSCYNNRLTEITTNTFGLLPSLTSLSLSANDLTNIAPGAFLSTPKLSLLDFSDNRHLPSNLSASVFSGLNQLMRLTLSGCRMSTFPTSWWPMIPNLYSISLWGNSFTSIPARTFYPLHRLSILFLSANPISSIDDFAFQGLHSLEQLSLSSSKLLRLNSSAAFVGLPGLKLLDLSSNKLQEIPTPIFTVLPNLTHLIMTNCPLVSPVVPDFAFSPLTNLTNLDIGITDISFVSPLAFHGLSRLTELLIGQNQLDERSFPALAPLISLQTLYFFLNNLTVIPANSFTTLGNLSKFHLGSNRISSIDPLAFEGLIALRDLDMSANLLSEIPSAAFNSLKGLEQLSLTLNTLTAVPSNAFAPLTSLQILHLGSMQIDSVSPTAFSNLSSITTISLTENRLSDLEFLRTAQLPTLEALAVGNNNLRTVDGGVFDQFSSLELIDLSSNQLTAVSPTAFDHCPGLKTVILTTNYLSSLPPLLFRNTPILEILQLDDNVFSAVPCPLIQSTPALAILLLSYNSITSIPSRCFLGNRMNGLFLDSNLISSIATDAFDGCVISQSVELGKNQLGDDAIRNLSKSLPADLQTLELNDNSITNTGVSALSRALPCTTITEVELGGNPLNSTTTGMSLAAQANALKKLCEAQRCQEIWPIDSCSNEMQ